MEFCDIMYSEGDIMDRLKRKIDDFLINVCYNIFKVWWFSMIKNNNSF